MLQQVFIGIIFMSLDAVPLIAVVNTPSGFHLKIGLVRAYAPGFPARVRYTAGSIFICVSLVFCYNE